MIFYNPHVDDFLAEPLQFKLLGRRALKKYGFVFDEALKNGMPIRILVDGTASGLIPESLFHNLPLWLRLVLANIELWLWKKINGFGEEVVRVTIPTAPVQEVLLAFSYKAATGRFLLRKRTLGHYRAVIFHLSHYFLATNEKAINIRCLPNAYLAGDSDIRGNKYFQRYFGWYNKPVLVLPFAVGSRFLNRKSWFTRDTKAVATGSFHDLRLEQPARKYIDFISTTGENTYHPVRLALYQRADQLDSSVNCKVSPYRQYGQSWLSRMLSHFRVAQKKYFSIDIVDLYNQHRYAVVGEELSGFPALGAFEAMACGCVLFGQPSYYVGLGLEPFFHYIPYEGQVEKLPKMLSSISNGSEISNNASHFVMERYSPSSVYKLWINTLRISSFADSN